MILMRYIDFYKSYYNEEGQIVDELVAQNMLTPFDTDLDNTSIGPFIGGDGVQFKNVSLVEDRYGKTHKVVGNYRKLIELRDNPPRKPIGYGK